MSDAGPRLISPEQTESRSLTSVLTQIGLILTPAGLIAAFCQVLSVSSQATGAASLATVFLTSICIYRKTINRYIPAALSLALLVGLGTVFFFNYQNILLKNTGLIEYYPHSNSFLGVIDKPISQAQQEMWFFGMNFNITSGERRTLLLKKLDGGIKIRYLVFDPRSPHLDELAKDFDQSPDELRSECEKGLQSILELRKQWSTRVKSTQSPGELDVRVFDAHPHARIYVFDPDRAQGETFFIPYINHVNSPEVPGFLLQNIRSGVFGAYFDGIRKLWADSKNLDNYLSLTSP
jgi:hypothetical protein